MRIEEVSNADTPAEVVGEQVIETQGRQVPIPFALPYEPGKIKTKHRYSLRARIENSAGRLLFINNTSVPVLINWNPTEDIEVILVPVGG